MQIIYPSISPLSHIKHTEFQQTSFPLVRWRALKSDKNTPNPQQGFGAETIQTTKLFVYYDANAANFVQINIKFFTKQYGAQTPKPQHYDLKHLTLYNISHKKVEKILLLLHIPFRKE